MQPQSLKNQEFRQGALLCLSLILLLLVAGGALYLDREERETATAVLEVNEPEKPRMLRDIPISARAAYVLDVNSGTVLFAKNETAQLPLASITKLMTALVILESLPSEGALTLTARDLEVEGDNGFISGERWNIGDLLEYTLTVSSNDGANALANAVSGLQAGAATHALDSFTELMNERAAYLGLSQMYFLNPTGLDSTQNISGGYGSARDVAYLLTYLIKESAAVLEATSNRQDVYYSLDNRQYVAENTNEIMNHIPGLIASKTGYTDLAGGNLAVAFDAGVNRPIVIAVLGSSREERFSDVEKLASAVLLELTPPISKQ